MLSRFLPLGPLPVLPINRRKSKAYCKLRTQLRATYYEYSYCTLVPLNENSPVDVTQQVIAVDPSNHILYSCVTSLARVYEAIGPTLISMELAI